MSSPAHFSTMHLTLRTAAVLLVAALTALTASAQTSSYNPPIDVYLWGGNEITDLAMRADGGSVEVLVGPYDAPALTVEEGDQVQLRAQGNELVLETSEGTLRALTVRFAAENDGAVELVRGEDARRYPGLISVRPRSEGGAFRLLNTIPLETYVSSVLGSEYGLDDVEGTRAMAIAIRTYALRSGGKVGPEADHVDGVTSQVYRGLDGISSETRAAAEATAGQVLTYGDGLIEAVYYSSSGGHTADNERVWKGNALPYLRGRPDPFDAISPHAEWTQRLSRDKVLRVLSRRSGSRVTGFLLGDRTPSGRVAEVELLGADRTISATTFRRWLNADLPGIALKSTFFDARRSGSSYVFEGRGYGHGVGLSQWGAHAQARKGHSHEQILAYYYRGTELRHLPDRATFLALNERGASSAPPPSVPETKPEIAQDMEPVSPATDKKASKVDAPAEEVAESAEMAPAELAEEATADETKEEDLPARIGW